MTQVSEIEKSFSPDAHGKRVGWVSAKEVHDGELLAVDVVSATVLDPEGATFGAWHWETDKGNSLPHPYQKGLGHTAAFSVLLGREKNWQQEFNFDYTPEGMKYPMGLPPEADDLLHRGTGTNRRYEDDENGPQKLWFEGAPQLIETLRTTLPSDFEDVYTTMYYLINGGIRSEGDKSALWHAKPESLLAPDALMADQTTQQLQQLRIMEQAYSQSITNDTNMRHRLSGFIGDTPMKELPALFIESRQRAAEYEKTVTEAARELAIRRLSYVPTGQGRSGRSWPFMDASSQDPNAAYGPELRELHDRRSGRAIAELDREINELSARRVLATESIQRFELLAQLEKLV